MTWCLYFLAENQEVQDRLVDEIDTVLGKTETVTAENVNHLP